MIKSRSSEMALTRSLPGDDGAVLDIEVPVALAAVFRARSGGEVGILQGRALAAGLASTARVTEQPGPADDPDPQRRHQQAAASLLYYVSHYWYTASLVQWLRSQVSALEAALAELDGQT